MRHVFGFVAAAVLAACVQTPGKAAADDQPRVYLSDLTMLEGAWTGELIYRDYEPPHEDVSLPATLNVSREGEGILLRLSFSDEPSAYGGSMLTPSEDGRMLNSEEVIARDEVDGKLMLKTQSACEDDGQPASCEMTYTLSPDIFQMTKRVQLDSGGPPFRRNTYAFERRGAGN